MSQDLNYDEVMERLHAYALGALEADEMLAVHRFLQRHQSMMTSLRRAEETAARLAQAAPEVALPPHAKAQLMQRIAAERVPAPAPRPRRTVPLPAARRAWAIAALLALLLLAQGALVLQSRAESAALRAERDRLAASFVLLAEPSQVVEISGTEAAPLARATLFVRGSEAMLLSHGLAAPASGESYQLWLIDGNGTPHSAGLLPSEAGHLAPTTLALPATALAFEQVGISREPAGGSAAPTGPLLMLSEATPP